MNDLTLYLMCISVLWTTYGYCIAKFEEYSLLFAIAAVFISYVLYHSFNIGDINVIS